MSRPVGKCGAVECGRNVTSVVVHASREPQDIDVAYRRAVKADAHNADLLRQYETYSLEYDKYGRGEGLADTAAIPCLICKGGQLCEVCTMEARYQVRAFSRDPRIIELCPFPSKPTRRQEATCGECSLLLLRILTPLFLLHVGGTGQNANAIACGIGAGVSC